MRIRDWSSDVCSSDLFDLLTNFDIDRSGHRTSRPGTTDFENDKAFLSEKLLGRHRQSSGPSFTPSFARTACLNACLRSEEHTSELQSLMRISYAVCCLKKKTNIKRVIKQSRK